MFANVSIRVKLLAVLVAPVLVMAGLVWLVVAPRLEATATADRTLRQAQLGGAALHLLDAVAAEREASALVLTGAPLPPSVDLSGARAEVDTSLRAFTDTAAGLDSPVLRRSVSGALDAAASLAALRDRVDRRSATPPQVLDDYSTLAEPFAQVGGNVAAGAVDADLVRQGHALELFVEGAQQRARLRAELAVRLAEGRFDGAAFGRAASLREEADRAFAQFEVRALPDDAVRFRATRATGEWTGAELALDQVIAVGSLSSLSSVDLGTWLASMDGQSAILSGSQAELAAGVRDAAAAASVTAESSAWWTLVMALAAVSFAVLAAGMLSRSIARRMGRVSEQAEEIATERIGEVLAARTVEDPGALPEVVADGRDEVGRLANAFNAVLGAAVASSLEHARRQHDTVTGLLTSLGRRNQAIIERQLEVIDGLEASHDDPELLAQLFRLDHLATSLRRNAENLLVLAADATPRGWHDPVSVFDVARGAASEVEDLDRVVIGVDPLDPSFVDGRFAVDLSHLLAELIENATRFSPPSTSVEVRLDYEPGHLRIEVADQGIGMSAEDLDSANRLLAAPVAIDELVADRVGFHVAARLASRLGVTVALVPGEGRGLVASVAVPFTLLVDRSTHEASPIGRGPLFPESARPAPRQVAAAAEAPRVDPLLDIDLEAPALPTPATMPVAPIPTPAAVAEVPSVPVPLVAPVAVPVAAVEPLLHPVPPALATGPLPDPQLAAAGGASPFGPSPFGPSPFAPPLLDRPSGSPAPFEPFGPAVAPTPPDAVADPWFPLDAVVEPEPEPVVAEPVVADPWFPLDAVVEPEPQPESEPVVVADPWFPVEPEVGRLGEADDAGRPAAVELAEVEDDAEVEEDEEVEEAALADGLVRRRPGQALGASRREDEVDAGLFRRLPVPGAPDVAADEARAAERRAALERLTTGVARGRSLFTRPAEVPAEEVPW